MYAHKIIYRLSAYLLTAILFIAPLHEVLGQTSRVTLGGVIGNQAILNIDGTPRTLATGQEHQGIKLLNAQGQSATILIIDPEGTSQKITLRVGDAPFTMNAPSSPSATGSTSNSSSSNIATSAERCIAAEQHVYVSRNGMFRTLGYINGKAVDFLVDTGATLVSMDEKQALALGITNYKQGHPITLQTANGNAPAYLITLDSVKVGQIEIKNVAASVGGNKEIILLGNSFLAPLEVEMTPNRLVLKKSCP